MGKAPVNSTPKSFHLRVTGLRFLYHKAPNMHSTSAVFVVFGALLLLKSPGTAGSSRHRSYHKSKSARAAWDDLTNSGIRQTYAYTHVHPRGASDYSDPGIHDYPDDGTLPEEQRTDGCLSTEERSDSDSSENPTAVYVSSHERNRLVNCQAYKENLSRLLHPVSILR